MLLLAQRAAVAARHGPGPAGVHADEQKHSTVVPQGVITSGLRTVVPALLAGAEAVEVQSAALNLTLALTPTLIPTPTLTLTPVPGASAAAAAAAAALLVLKI